MTSRARTLSELNHLAIKLLSENLGIADTFRFVNQFTTGFGDYTKEREGLFGHLSLEEIVSAIEQKRTEPERGPAGTATRS